MHIIHYIHHIITAFIHAIHSLMAYTAHTCSIVTRFLYANIIVFLKRKILMGQRETT